MDRTIVVRKESLRVASELIQSTIMSWVTPTFFSFLFKEAVIQMSVLIFALSFIFFGVPVWWCLTTVPLTIVLVYVYSYTYHLYKYMETMNSTPIRCWVAEVYEPLFSTADPRDFSYRIVNEKEFLDANPNTTNHKKTLVGVVCVKMFVGPFNKLWMCDLAVDPKYRRKGLGTYLTKSAFEYARAEKYESLDLVITDLQCEARLMFTKLGFKVQSFYHKKILGYIPLEKYQMNILTGAQADY